MPQMKALVTGGAGFIGSHLWYEWDPDDGAIRDPSIGCSFGSWRLADNRVVDSHR